jgi:AcrR family transcriptional regulator
MKSAAELTRAPKRGRYDRALSRHERQAEQRERVVAAIVEVAADGRELSVASVVEAAGIGRNTFYEYFDDVEHALRAISGRARSDFMSRVDTALQLARTPLERVRALARVWAESLIADPAVAKLALRAEPSSRDPAQLSALGRHLAEVLENEVVSRSALPGLSDRLRTTAVAALFDVVGRAQLADGPMAPEELQRVLADLAVRLLR